MPLIGKYQPIARLGPTERSQCEYNQTTGRYCAPLKTVITAASVKDYTNSSAAFRQSHSVAVLRPRLSFTVSGTTSASREDGAGRSKTSDVQLVLLVHSYTEATGVGEILAELPLSPSSFTVGNHRSMHRAFRWKTRDFFRANALSPREEWIVVTVENRDTTLVAERLTVDVHYASTGID